MDLKNRVKHIVGFSGGIDSQACARWVLNRFPPEDVLLTNSNAGQWEDPITEAFIEEYSKRVHPVIRTNAIVADLWETPGYAETRGLTGTDPLTFAGMVKVKGRPPSRKAQFCTEILKLRPQRRWLRQVFGPGGEFEGWDYIRYTGVRRDESDRRSKTPIKSWDDWFDCPLLAPIADWTKQMCFDYVRLHGEPINELYRLGFSRVGCAPCINSSKADILNWLQKRPEMIEKVRRLEAETGRTFFSPIVPGQSIHIDEVVKWAQTAHGGKQFRILFDSGEGGCESKYGLCE